MAALNVHRWIMVERQVKRRMSGRELLALAALAALGVAVVAGVALAGFAGLPPLGMSTVEKVIVLVSLPLLYLVAIAVHELGHVGGAALAGFRTVLFIAGPVRIEWRPAGRRSGLNRSLLLAGGLVVCAPVGSHDLRSRTIVMVAGGPLASLFAGVQFLGFWHIGAAALLRDDVAFAAQWLGVALLALGLSSLLIGMISLFPARTAGFYSDGARILRLMRAGADADREVALLSLTGMSLGGMRPRAWDALVVQRCAALADGGPFEVGGRHYAFLHALDRGDTDAARVHADFVLQRIHQLPRGSRASLLLAIATFHALFLGDVASARQLIGAARESLVATPHQYALAEAAIRLGDGDRDGARRLAGEAIRLAGDALDSGAAQLDVALAERIIERATAA